jgi:hypothetical protein
VADFGVVITIAVAVGVDMYLAFDTPKLMVPLKFEVFSFCSGFYTIDLRGVSNHVFLFV